MRARRWSDNDHYFGPFTYARDRTYRPFALMLSSGDDEDRGCEIRFSAFGHTFISALPPIVRPWRKKVMATSWDAATVERLGRDWYYDTHRREYGFSLSRCGAIGDPLFLRVHFGAQTHDSSTTQDWCKFLPWTSWRHVRWSHYDLNGDHYWTEPKLGRYERNAWEAKQEKIDSCPSRTFAFKDYDGEELTARTRIMEGEWRFGTGWFKWLSLFRKPRITRSLDIQFSGETGKRKGSWKGGTIGHSINMLPGELHESAFRRYCAEHQMKFMDERPPLDRQVTF